MKEKSTMKPILFSTPMVQAILEGRNTQTRRVVKPQPIKKGHFWTLDGAGWSSSSVVPVYGHSLYTRMPYKPGDILWVRETWYLETFYGAHSYVYRASEPNYPVNVGAGQHGWRPSIFMPKDVARIFLRVKEVRVEKVQDITEEDTINEGVNNKEKFALLWDKLNKKRGYGWEANPWVWVIEFERIEKPEVTE
jgi:hypothetical protein